MTNWEKFKKEKIDLDNVRIANMIFCDIQSDNCDDCPLRNGKKTCHATLSDFMEWANSEVKER